MKNRDFKRYNKQCECRIDLRDHIDKSGANAIIFGPCHSGKAADRYKQKVIKNLNPEQRKRRGKRLKETIQVLDCLLSQAKSDALSFAEDLGTMSYYAGSVMSTFWDCPKSPFGLCVYDHWKDGAHDDCLFCHDPEERK